MATGLAKNAWKKTELQPRQTDQPHRGSSFDVNIPMYSSQKTVSLEIPLKAGI